eukprot:999801-Amphidinium_carterae.1
MQKLMRRAGCSLLYIREAYNSYYEGIPGQQKQKVPQVVPEEDESEDEESRSQSMFDRSDVSNNASNRASYKGRGKVTSEEESTDSASELTTRPVIQQFTGHVTITNFTTSS